jgi:hypothetical protein
VWGNKITTKLNNKIKRIERLKRTMGILSAWGDKVLARAKIEKMKQTVDQEQMLSLYKRYKILRKRFYFLNRILQEEKFWTNLITRY